MMDRSPKLSRTFTLLVLAGVTLVSATGCLHNILATGIYLWQGGDVVPAECEALEGQRVVVICRPPSSHEYRHAGAAREIGKNVSYLLEENVPKIDVVSPREVDNWIDEQDWDNYKDLGRAVKANRVVYIELDEFDLYKGSTLYQGDADLKITCLRYGRERRTDLVEKHRPDFVPAQQRHSGRRQVGAVVPASIRRHRFAATCHTVLQARSKRNVRDRRLGKPVSLAKPRFAATEKMMGPHRGLVGRSANAITRGVCRFLSWISTNRCRRVDRPRERGWFFHEPTLANCRSMLPSLGPPHHAQTVLGAILGFSRSQFSNDSWPPTWGIVGFYARGRNPASASPPIAGSSNAQVAGSGTMPVSTRT